MLSISASSNLIKPTRVRSVFGCTLHIDGLKVESTNEFCMMWTLVKYTGPYYRNEYCMFVTGHGNVWKL